MSWVEIVASVFGFFSAGLTVKQNIWCWPTGIISVFLFIFVFYDAKLYSDMMLQMIFVVLQIYGWYFWLHGGKDQKEVPVLVLNGGRRIFWGGVTLIGSLLLGHFMSTRTNADVAYIDATQTVMSLIAQYLQAFKALESWIFWITVDVISIGLYLYKKLYFTTGLYCLFLGIATMGYFEWRRSLLNRSKA